MPEGTITDLHPQQHDQQRVSLFIDGAFALGVSLETLTREELYTGKYLDQAAWARLEAAESVSRAFQAALRLLQARPRSVAELHERLTRKGLPPAAIEAALDRLVRLELLDDAAFARAWVRNRQQSRPRGQQALRHELASKGIDRELVAATLADADLLGDEQEHARNVARAALPKYASAPDQATFQRRLGGYLQRRGFTYATIRPILAELWREVQQ